MTNLLNAQQSAEALGVSPEWIHRYRRNGMLTPTYNVGRMHLYDTDALHDLLDTLDAIRADEIAKLRSNLPPRGA